jgi:mRNA interferase RelE/StbE
MSYEVRLHPSVVKFLGELEEQTRNRIKETLRQLQKDPFKSRPNADIKKLKGTRGGHDFLRLRVGDYRVIYAVEGDVVWVTDIFVRGRGYLI